MSKYLSFETRRFAIWMILALIVVIADQVTKWAIVEYVELYAKVPLYDFINLTHQRNYGAAFSFLADAGGWQRWCFVTLATAVSIFIAVWIYKIRHEGPMILAAGLSLVLGGAAVGTALVEVGVGSSPPPQAPATSTASATAANPRSPIRDIPARRTIADIVFSL